MKRGRPIKYASILVSLEDETLYTPASIAAFAEARGKLIFDQSMSNPPTEKDIKLAKQRIRVAMGRYGQQQFKDQEMDGMLKISGQAPTPAYFGKRWKKSVLSRFEEL